MKDVKLNNEDLSKLAELIVKTNLQDLKFTPSEAKLLFNLDNDTIELKHFSWKIRAGFVKGKISKGLIGKNRVFETVIYPPKLLAADYIETYKWHSLSVVAASLEFMNFALTSPILLERVMVHLEHKFEYLSLGQAKAIIKRKLEISLSQVERNDLHRLRKKFDGYQMLIDAFSEMVDKKVGSRRLHTPANIRSPEDSLSSAHYKMKFMCNVCKTYQEFPDSAHPVISPEHHGKPMILTWGSPLSAEEATSAYQELTAAVTKGISGLDQIEAVTLTEEGKTEINSMRDELIDQIKDLEVMANNKELSEGADQAVNILQSIDLEVDSYKDILRKIRRETWRSLEHMQLTIILEKSSRRKLLELKRFAKKLENLTRRRMMLSDGTDFEQSGFNPAKLLAALKPIPKQEQVESKFDIQYFCQVCSQYFVIPDEKKAMLLRSDDADLMEHPEHHGEEMKIRIIEKGE